MKRPLKLNIPRDVFNEVYLPVRERRERYIHLWGGAGSGKSVFAAQNEIIKSFEPGQRTLVIRKVNRTLKNSVMSLFKDIMYDWKLVPRIDMGREIRMGNLFRFYTNEIVNLKTGSRIILTGLDDPEKIKSIAGIRRVWIEEATELSQEDYQQLDLRLRGADNLQMVFTYNPIDKDHWLNQVFHLRHDPDVFTLKTTYRDNKFIDAKYTDVLERLKTTDENYYKIYALGEWGGMIKGLVYPNVRYVEEFPKDCKWVTYGLDFGFANHFTALVKVGYKEGELFFQELIYELGMTNLDIANRLRFLGFTPEDVIWADSAEPKSITELQHYGFNVRKTQKGEICYGIDLVKQYLLNVCKDSPNLHKEFSRYKWLEDANGRVLNKPVDLYNHLMDALRYAVIMKMGRRKLVVG